MRDKLYEKKIRPRLWKIKYIYFTKRRPKKGTAFVKARQYAIKTGKDTYKLIMKGKRY